MTVTLTAHKRLGRYGFAQEALACEVIDFQQDKFGSQLEAILLDMKKFMDNCGARTLGQLRSELMYSDFGKILSDLIMKRMGFKTKFVFNTTSIGAVMPMLFNEHHILLDPIWRGNVDGLTDQQKLIKQSKDLVGTVDLAKAKVGGIFSEYEHIVWIDIVGHFYVHKSDAGEIVAILLHEFGHAFTHYEFADRLESTNQVLADLSKETRKENGGSGEQRKYLLKELSTRFGIKDDSFDDIIEEKNLVIFGFKLFKRYIEFVKSQLPNAKYDETSSEQLADNFATRFGYGRQLVTVLDRFYINAPEHMSSGGHFALTFMEFLTGIVMPAVMIIGTMMIGLIPVGLLLLAFYTLIIYASGTGAKDMTYDELKIRYKRIRQQYIEMTHKLDMDKEQLRSVVDNIHFIDGVINNTAIYRSLYERISNFLFASNRAAKNDIELQYLLENLTHSDLFLKSAELTVLS